MPPYDKTRKTLAEYGLAPSKSRGQNFLVNQQTAQRIVSAADFASDDHIVEVGVGLGALTIPLASSVTRVLGIEIDSGIIRYHQKENSLPDNVELYHEDILKTDLLAITQQLKRPLKILANLPYSISNPFLFKMIDNRSVIDQVVVMLQKEVCERLTASSGTKEYGIPTVLLSSCATISTLLNVNASEFHPKPKIDSQVIRIDFFKDDPLPCSFTALQKLVRSSFQNRRKTLLNNLRSAGFFKTGLSGDKTLIKDELRKVIQRAGLEPEMRAESITVIEFQRLTATFEEAGMI
jgi:16S rRNA (adenine1518-N6/adenine1519-N6)-dimethyltransferase